MALAYLHPPITTVEAALEPVNKNEIESQHLDFKESFWDANPNEQGHEAAKDIAAFANSTGGTILVGVKDLRDRAAGLNAEFKHAGKRHKLESWIQTLLVPAGIGNHIDTYELTTANGQELLSINVPPWPYGVIGVPGKDKKDGSWFFPFRVGRDTKFLSLDEAMARNHAAHRLLFLKLRRLMDTTPSNNELAGPPVRIISPLFIKIDHGGLSFEEPAPLSKGGQGAIIKLEDDSITLAMNKYGGNYFSVENRFSLKPLPKTHLESFHQVTEHGAHLSIPFDLISAAWRGAENPPTIHLAIRGIAYWHRNQWALRISDR